MRRTIHKARICAWLLLWCVCAGTVQAQVVAILATEPPATATLPPGQSFHVSLRYQSEVPLRFSVRGHWHGGEVRDGLRTNPSPVYPAGSGEAIVWLEYTGAAELDELRLHVSDERWQPMSVITLPVTLRWQPGATRAQGRSADMDVLSRQQQNMVSAAMHEQFSYENSWVDTALLAMAWSVPGYMLLQILLPLLWRRGWRTLALLPLIGTVPVLLFTLAGLLQGANLWPLVMLFTLPFAFAYLVILMAVRWFLSQAVR